MGGTPVWNEQAPGQQGAATNPAAAISGIRQLLAQLAAARQGQGQQQGGAISPAVVPSLPSQGQNVQPVVGGGVSGQVVPPPTPDQAPASLPARNSTADYRVTGSNASTRGANVASSAADAMGQAVYNFQAKKQADNVSKAQSSFRQYQQAVAAGDLQTANYIATNPKVVASWEKYLNEYISKVPLKPGGVAEVPGKESPMGVGTTPQPAAPGQMGGVNQPGGLAVPRNMNPIDPLAQAKLDSERALTGSRQAEAVKFGAEAHKADIEGNTEVVKAQAELLAKQAEAVAAKAKADESKAMEARIDPQNKRDIAEAKKFRAEADLAWARAEQAAKGAKDKLTLTAFNAASTRIKDERNFVAKDLAASQKTSEANRSSFGKMLGSDPEVTPEQQALGNRLKALSRTNSVFNAMQDDIVNGKISVEDAQTKARRENGLTSDYQLWSAPSQTQNGTAIPAAPPKGFPDGSAITDSDGTPLAVAEKGHWVAP